MNKGKSALIIVDMQVGVVAQAHQREAVISNINALITKARAQQIPIIWVQHSDSHMTENSPDWQIVEELKPLPSDIRIHKKYGDSFEGTSLSAELKKLDARKLIVAGAQTDACIRSTIHGAFARGYDTTLVSDAHTTEDLTSFGYPAPEQLIHFTNSYWSSQAAPDKTAAVVKTEDVIF